MDFHPTPLLHWELDWNEVKRSVKQWVADYVRSRPGSH